MEWGKVFDLLKTILTSWPLAAVVIVFAIRKSLKTVIENRLFSFKVGNVEIIFDRLLNEVDRSLKEASQLSEEQAEQVDAKESKGAEYEYSLKDDIDTSIVRESNEADYINFSEEEKSPRALVKDSWRHLSHKIRQLVRMNSRDFTSFSSINNCIHFLSESVIPNELGDALYKLLTLRDLLIRSEPLRKVDATIFHSRCLNAMYELDKYIKKAESKNY
ncbi:hypothetical protein A6g_18445 [Bacillus velezensis]|uniref:hypothetical protein n=1 Tax=Bacillus velezensis TaxID=492670 RepID=UPI0009D51455|nr:hypothetical protein [Bacillus velezensis]RXK26471.1 hypothetical protein A6g_18445 [Bacillus velezensis]SLC53384.1 Uncharacterised protein [Mycobacteroides abscessus subsp. massiliense]